jgi:hypothetical protein
MVGLACILTLNFAVITFVWLHQAGGARKGLLIALWLLALVALVLLIRLWNALRRSAPARGVDLDVK